MEFYTRDVRPYHGFFVWILLHDDVQEYNRPLFYILCFSDYPPVLFYLFFFSSFPLCS